MERVYLTRLHERDNIHPFDAYLVSAANGAWVELENEAHARPLYVGLLDLANEHVPANVLRVLAGHERPWQEWVVFGLPIPDRETARLRYLIAHRGSPPHRALPSHRLSPLAG